MRFWSIVWVLWMGLTLLQVEGSAQSPTSPQNQNNQTSALSIDTSRFKLNKPRKWILLPSVYYTPETRWAFGAIGLGFFRFSKEDTLSPISNVGLSLAYTLNDQILFSLPFNLFLKGDRYRIRGSFPTTATPISLLV
ncbi:hypothetical protein KFE98_13825 [bacterium SCSIO 12741]|nr:hypothetical protein KFE98_13825 [bacterium SCSIO 12741]